jgi:hypothetical protein
VGELRLKRVEKLEERRRKRSKTKHASASREIPEHECRLRWEVSSRHRRAERMPRSAKHARSIIIIAATWAGYIATQPRA